MGSQLYHQLLDTPDLKLVLARVESALQAEAQKRQEFYEWLTPEVKAEFINGEVIMHSPAKNRHLKATEALFALIYSWVEIKQLGVAHTEKALIALTRNDYEPDICFWGKDKAAAFDEDTMLHPAPDLVVEVLSLATTPADKGIKYKDYAAHGIAEYWIVDPYRETIEAFTLDQEFMQYEGGTVLTVKDQLARRGLPGFGIPVRAVFDAKVRQGVLRSFWQDE